MSCAAKGGSSTVSESEAALDQPVVNLVRGLGGWLLQSAIELAWDKGPKKLTVNTCTLDHPKALPLYQKMGFQPTRREDFTIDDPRETGVIPSEE